MENDWSGSFVLLFGWNHEDVRWEFFPFKSIGKLWTILSFATSRKTSLASLSLSLSLFLSLGFFFCFHFRELREIIASWFLQKQGRRRRGPEDRLGKLFFIECYEKSEEHRQFPDVLRRRPTFNFRQFHRTAKLRGLGFFIVFVYARSR